MNISGQFRITPTGEIILNPLNQDMRSVAGLSGDFRINQAMLAIMTAGATGEF